MKLIELLMITTNYQVLQITSNKKKFYASGVVLFEKYRPLLNNEITSLRTENSILIIELK